MTTLRVGEDAVSGDNPLPVAIAAPPAPAAEWVFAQVVAQAITANTPVLLATPNPGRRFRIMGYHLGVAASVAARFKAATNATAAAVGSTEKLRTAVITTNSSANSPAGMEVMGFPLGNVGDALYLDLSGSTTIHGFVMLKEETP